MIREASAIVGSDYIQSDKYLQDIVRDKRYWENKRQSVHQREKDLEKTIAKYEEEIKELAQNARTYCDRQRSRRRNCSRRATAISRILYARYVSVRRKGRDEASA